MGLIKKKFNTNPLKMADINTGIMSYTIAKIEMATRKISATI